MSKKQQQAPADQPKKKAGRPTKEQKAKMEAALAKLDEQQNKKISVLLDEVENNNSIVAQVIRAEAQKIVEQKAEEIRQEITKVRRVLRRDRVYKKFSCQELIAIFNGWFTLTYAFSIQNDELSPNGEPIETDFYICSQDVSQMDVNKRPPVNLAIQREFGKTVYGFAIIAPATAF